jgi:GT2 family glycosyltransferase
VIVPTRDRPESLYRCLAALDRQTHARDRMEVILVDSGNRTDLSLVAARHRGLEIGLVRGNGDGPAAARNRGAQAASAERLAFLDDDARPDPGWLAALAAAHSAEPQDIHGGPVRAIERNLPSRATQAIAEAALGARPDGSALLLPACNLSVPARGFRELGGFNSGFWISEDREFCERWRRRGRSIRLVPGAVVEHEHPRSLASFWVTHFRYGRGALAYHRDQARRGHLAMSVRSSASTASRLARRGAREPALAPLIALWSIATASGIALQAASTIGERSAGHRRAASSATDSRIVATKRSGANR